MAAIDTSPSTSASLLLRASEGDGQAWHRIVQLYAPLVYKWCRRYGLGPEDAADASQETFAALSQRIGTFDPSVSGATFRGWLRTVTHNKVMDLYRIRQTGDARGGTANVAALADLDAGDPTLGEVGSSGSGAPDRSDRKEVLRRALAILRPRFEQQTWTAFWRTTVDGCSPEDVADELGISRWSVYKARSRVLHRLRSELEGLERF
ncbi:MAG TPA: sigma-70 family RNA polymerase sigma factor [Planctomycetaceae bacterium]|nr:sigma-70 family RNA polymerase sigma factor [Planctomycetaceae bacterium]